MKNEKAKSEKRKAKSEKRKMKSDSQMSFDYFNFWVSTFLIKTTHYSLLPTLPHPVFRIAQRLQ